MISPVYGNLEPPVNPDNRYGYKIYPERWLVLLISFVANFISSTLSTRIILYSTNDLTNETVSINETDCPSCNGTTDLQYYSSNTSINVLINPIMFLFLIYPALLVSLKLKLKLTLITGLILTLIGGLIKTLPLVIIISIDSVNFVLGYLGQFIVSSGQPFLILTSVIVSQFWFPSFQRTFVTSIIIFAQLSGYLLDFVIHTSINHQPYDGSSTNFHLYYNLILVIITFITLVAASFISKSNPPTPPSSSSEDKARLIRNQKALLLQPSLIVQVLLFSTIYGSIQFITFWHTSLLCLDGYLFSFPGFHSLFIIVISLSGTVLISMFIDQFHKYKKMYRLALAITTFGFGLIAWVIEDKDRGIIMFISLFLISFFGIGLMGVGIEAAVESVFPIHPVIITAILLASGNFFYILLIIGSYFIKKLDTIADHPSNQCEFNEDGTITNYSDSLEVISIITCISFILCLLAFHVQRRRYDYESTVKLMRISIFNTYQSRQAFYPDPPTMLSTGNNDQDEENNTCDETTATEF